MVKMMLHISSVSNKMYLFHVMFFLYVSISTLDFRAIERDEEDQQNGKRAHQIYS